MAAARTRPPRSRSRSPTFVIASARGRATQMNAGAAIARGDVLLFLHADTRLPPDADRLIRDGLAQSQRAWGRFDVAIDGKHPLLPVIAAFDERALAPDRHRHRRSGDVRHARCIRCCRRISRDRADGGHRRSRARLKRISPPLCLHARVTTSGRRWERRGVLRTILLMWRLRLAYFFGASPESLARRYNA